ncbi:hypothetical protein NDU88_002503 [Pleurodeles waltl]|uniref:Uncharacterized protein n=1 Tax=Pleurodeles waltl TaxID=8319 RepID=A0AAV7W2C2_PLEWA|nr:hypothetical protein NDU88_002503 [Pleurodeles waltl]
MLCPARLGVSGAPVSWILLSRTPSQHPAVSGRRSRGLPAPAPNSSGPPVPLQSRQCLPGFTPGPVVPCSLSSLGVCQGPEPHLKLSGLAACPRVTPSPRRRFAPSLSLSWPCSVPDPFWGLARVLEQRHFAAQQSASSVGPPGPDRHLRHSRKISPASPAILRSGAQREATAPTAVRPPSSPGAARLQERRLAAPRLGATSPGLPGPLQHLRRRWRTRPESPVALSRLPSRHFGSRPHARPRLRPHAQASGHQSLLLADSGTLRGHRGGPLTLDPFHRLRPTAWTPIGPGKVRFRAHSRRPLRSEKFRRAPSPGPWPRPHRDI